MKYNPVLHHRKSIRLKDYDYSQQGAYFVTTCTFDGECLFGNIGNGEMHLNKYGEIVFEEWQQSSTIRKEIELDEFIIMPNHIHMIVFIVGANGRSSLHSTFRMKPKSISSFMSGFKSSVTKRINILRKTPGTPVWQRNYYDHIIRNKHKLNKIREYIINNPLKWHLDRENTHRQGSNVLEDEIFNKTT